jgi:hypothetical protein
MFMWHWLWCVYSQEEGTINFLGVLEEPMTLERSPYHQV